MAATFDELRERLVAVLRADAKVDRRQTTAEMAAVRVEARIAGLDYNSLVVDACQQVKAEKKSKGN